jgi:hypothetical protein
MIEDERPAALAEVGDDLRAIEQLLPTAALAPDDEGRPDAQAFVQRPGMTSHDGQPPSYQRKLLDPRRG